MFRYWKTIIVFLIIISPLLYVLFIGYPMKNTAPLPGQSSRCFKVGELKEFVECYQTGRRSYGGSLMKDVLYKTSSFHPFAGSLFLILLLSQVFLLLIVLF